MTLRPRLLDLFSGAGGAARGYQIAGFHVTGVDINPQPRYCGDEFVQADAMTFPLDGFDAIHASPVCKLWSQITRTAGPTNHVDQIAPLRPRLIAADVPVRDRERPRRTAHRPPPALRLHVRHGHPTAPDCSRRTGRSPITCGRVATRSGDRAGIPTAPTDRAGSPASSSWPVEAAAGRVVAWPTGVPRWGIAWMTRDELAQAIPPVYTEFIGRQLIDVVKAAG